MAYLDLDDLLMLAKLKYQVLVIILQFLVSVENAEAFLLMHKRIDYAARPDQKPDQKDKHIPLMMTLFS
jgi:hypothetical protein